MTPGVVVTKHAVEMLRHRSPDLVKGSLEDFGFVLREVQAAIEAGRKSAHHPRWLRQRPGKLTRRSEQTRGARYVWDEDARRCYLLRKHMSRKTGRRVWVVITMMARKEEA